MADYKVTDTELTSVANAIRTRGGTSSQLIWPNGFATAVNNIGNTFTASDEGKVVSNQELIAQTSRSITENGTYDTTTNNSVTVYVSGGGGEGLRGVANVLWDYGAFISGTMSWTVTATIEE